MSEVIIEDIEHISLLKAFFLLIAFLSFVGMLVSSWIELFLFLFIITGGITVLLSFKQVLMFGKLKRSFLENQRL